MRTVGAGRMPRNSRIEWPGMGTRNFKILPSPGVRMSRIEHPLIAGPAHASRKRTRPAQYHSATSNVPD